MSAYRRYAFLSVYLLKLISKMKHKVEILPSAWEDLKKIENYYEIQFDVETAIKISDHILDVIERLEEFPDSGSLTPDKWLNDRGYRIVIC